MSSNERCTPSRRWRERLPLLAALLAGLAVAGCPVGTAPKFPARIQFTGSHLLENTTISGEQLAFLRAKTDKNLEIRSAKFSLVLEGPNGPITRRRLVDTTTGYHVSDPWEQEGFMHFDSRLLPDGVYSARGFAYLEVYSPGVGFTYRGTVRTSWRHSIRVDNGQSTVEIVLPEDGAEVTESFDVLVQGSTAAPPASVTVVLGGVVTATISDASGTVSLDSAGVSHGRHTLEATLTDKGGKTATDVIHVRVNHMTVDILDPPLGTVLTGTFGVDARAAGGAAPYRYELSVDGSFVGAYTGDELRVTGLDSNAYSEGPHRLTVDVTDDEGLTGRAEVDVIVDNSDAGRIVFASDRDGDFEIYVIDADDTDGSTLRPLTDNDAYDGDPCWSPDGKRIAFLSNRHDKDGENADLYVMDDRGNVEDRFLYFGTDAINVEDPVWGPGPEQVTVTVTGFGNDIIMTIDLPPVNRTHEYTRDVSDAHPTISPDGGTICFARAGTLKLIDVLPIAPNERTLATGDSAWHPAWSPPLSGDRTLLAYSRDWKSLYVVDPKGGSPTPLLEDTGTYNCLPAWSPDGRRIAFVRWPLSMTAPAKILILDVEKPGDPLIELPGQAGACTDPDWGP